METIYKWSHEFPGPTALPTYLETNYSKLIEIIEAVQGCITIEFGEDEKAFKEKYGRTPNPDERPSMHPPFYSYDGLRKDRFVNCVREKTHNILQFDDNYRVNVAFRLWPACLTTSKEISAGTQTGQNTLESRKRQFENIINPYSQNDAIFRAGQKTSPFFKHKVSQGQDVFFDGIPAGSAILEIKDVFENVRKGLASV